jgi:excisionase family DNA binding protein
MSAVEPLQAEPLTLSVAQAARISGLSQHAIRRAVRDGTIASLFVGRLLRIPRMPLLRLCGVDLNEGAAEANRASP